jgi:hypothetical protein
MNSSDMWCYCFFLFFLFSAWRRARPSPASEVSRVNEALILVTALVLDKLRTATRAGEPTQERELVRKKTLPSGWQG